MGATYVRKLVVKIDLETNNYDHEKELTRHEDETWDEFIERVAETLREMMPE